MRSLLERKLLRCAALQLTSPRSITGQRIRPLIQRTYCSSCDSAKPPNSSPSLEPKDEPKSTISQQLSPDHRIIGTQQELFTSSLYSPGSPLFLPNGASIFNKLVNFLRAQYTLFSFSEVITPTIYKKSLWQISGHWQNYNDNMFHLTGSEEATNDRGEQYSLKPMNCPGHCLLYKTKKRSYRELPIRYADFSALHRNELSGALSGLTRVRRFHQDDGHIFCRPSQIETEILSTLKFVSLVYNTFRLGPYRLVLSTRPEKDFIGSVEEWNTAESALRKALDDSGADWELNEGDGAFYGPKIDIMLKDAAGKEHQTATIQLDFQLPKRFELEYVAGPEELEKMDDAKEDESKESLVKPVMIHRAILGSLERFFALLCEQYGSSADGTGWPFWIHPRQLRILPLNTKPEVIKYAQDVVRQLQGIKEDQNIESPELTPRALSTSTYSIDIDSNAESVSNRIRLAKQMQYAIVVVVGPRDMKKGVVTVDFGRVDLSRIPSKEIVEMATEKEKGDGSNLVQLTIPQLRTVLEELEATYS